jgi:hypothetical protein
MIFKDLGRSQAARVDAERALDLCYAANVLSDIDLSILNLCDILLDLGKDQEAQAYFERIISEVEARNRLPFEFIKARIQKKSEINSDEVKYFCPHYKARIEKLQLHIITSSFKPNLTKLEESLYKSLKKRSLNRQQLAEVLWPKELHNESHFNRIYQLVYRLNSKIPQKIKKSKNMYLLQ